MSLLGRVHELGIYGPHGTEEAINKLLTAGEQRVTFPVKISELKPNQDITIGKLVVKTASADHDIPALAYRIETGLRPGKFDDRKAEELGVPKGPLRKKLVSGDEIEIEGRTIKPEMLVGPQRKGSSLVYSGDSRASEEIEKLAYEVDLLIHEATLLDEKKAREFGHATPKEAAALAKGAKVGKLVLTHVSQRHNTDEMVNQSKEIFRNTISANDMMKIEL
jgi:ribonuclease Z